MRKKKSFWGGVSFSEALFSEAVLFYRRRGFHCSKAFISINRNVSHQEKEIRPWGGGRGKSLLEGASFYSSNVWHQEKGFRCRKGFLSKNGRRSGNGASLWERCFVLFAIGSDSFNKNVRGLFWEEAKFVVVAAATAAAAAAEHELATAGWVLA